MSHASRGLCTSANTSHLYRFDRPTLGRVQTVKWTLVVWFAPGSMSHAACREASLRHRPQLANRHDTHFCDFASGRLGDTPFEWICWRIGRGASFPCASQTCKEQLPFPAGVKTPDRGRKLHEQKEPTQMVIEIMSPDVCACLPIRTLRSRPLAASLAQARLHPD